MAEAGSDRPRTILTPDQRLRVFVSSVFEELAVERAAVSAAITALHMTPVMPDMGARAHAPQELYRSYLDQSEVFVGIYGQRYGWGAPDMAISTLEDEYGLSAGKPRLLYVKRAAGDREPELVALLDRIRADGESSYRTFTDPQQLGAMVADDLAVLLTERFTNAGQERPRDHHAIPRVPVTASSFVGRDREMEAVAHLLADPTSSIVTLCGPGGVGKTRIALEVAQRTRGNFPDGAVVVWLDAIRDPALVLQALAAELQVPETASQPLLEAIGARLRDTRMLVILDNFEHVIAAAPRLADLAAMTATSKFLVTSRELLHVRGERAVDLDPLPVPEADALDMHTIATTAGVRLFVDRARAVAPAFALDHDNAAAVAEIVRCLEGLPLALELAAARVRVLPPQALLDRLPGRLDLPAKGGRDLPERQRTLRSTIGWSYELLDAAERAALEHFSVFARGADLDAAEFVLAAVAEPTAVLDILSSLLDKSLLRRVEDDRGLPRLRMLAAIRAYAFERLEERGAVDAARERHLAFFRQLAADTAVRLHSADQAACLAAFEREHDNLQADLDWLITQERGDAGFELAEHLRWFWYMRGHLTTADHYLHRLLALPGGSARGRGKTLVSSGMILWQLGELERAQREFESAVALLTDDPDALAWARTGLGAVLQSKGESVQAEALQQEALSAFRSHQDLLGQCTANTRMAMMSLARGDYARAEEQFHGSLAVRRTIRDPWGTSVVLTSLGRVRIAAGDFSGAKVYLDEALSLVRQIGYLNGIAQALDALGEVTAAGADWKRAADLFSQAFILYTDVGDRLGMAIARAHLARAEVELADMTAAGRHALEAVDLATHSGDAASLVVSIEALGCVLGTVAPEQAAVLFGAAAGLRTQHALHEPTANPFAVAPHVTRLAGVLGEDALRRARRAGEELSSDDLGAALAAARRRLADLGIAVVPA